MRENNASKAKMTSRERILTTMRRGQPDRVPVIPDISNMVPCRLLGKPFWDIYLHEDPPLSDAYINAVKYYGMDGWYIYDNLTMKEEPKWTEKILEKTDDEIKASRFVDTPFGRLEEVMAYPVKDPPWRLEGMIKDVAADFPKLKWYMDQKPLNDTCADKKKVGDWGIFGLAIETFMGFWVTVRDGGSMQAVMDFAEQPEMMARIRDYYLEYVDRVTHIALRDRPDEILIQGSASSLSLSSPRIYRNFDLPLIKLISSLCKKEDLICHQHTCGKSRLIVEINYNETDIGVMEPLERAPGGDVDLAEVKAKFGDKFCLKGNVNTFETMLNGSVKDVEAEAKWCIDAAAKGGGFILSTGDQCGRDTPDDNLFALVETAKNYGKYT
ncbi:MAG: hypothetical protein M1469_04525 [Bacteroidetes bacterium]|nr:hypothetical protein [Bacteroidota bacterium]